ncbi:MAG: hypothetical protein IJA97_06380 [Clostridia bacterium]|nr:hypothetical protein [Clostridia bacterium]
MKHTITLTDKQKTLFNSIRTSWFDIVSYLSEEEIKDSCESLCPQAFSFCTHDRDVDKDGNLKKLHTHIVLCFKTRKRALSLAHIFNTTELRAINTSVQLLGSYEYLIHQNEVDKVKYESSKRYVSNEQFFNDILLTSCDGKDDTLSIIDNIITGVPTRKLVALYGRDFVYHFNQYKEVAMAIVSEERAKKSTMLLEEVDVEDLPFD